MLVLQTLLHVWPLTLFIAGFFGILAFLALRLKMGKRDWECAPMPVFYLLIAAWFLLLSLLLTLIDEPRLDALKGIESLAFMVSAFFGIPFSIPLLAVAVHARVCALHGTKLGLGAALLMALGTFALGLAASNIHDIVWCGAITEGFAKNVKAGGDLDAFAWLGGRLGIPDGTMYDYLTLGSSAFVMVLGEVAWALACFARLARLKQDAPEKTLRREKQKTS
ncbi:MAG: hypothetical protein GX580_15195 [Candidatus Hydrogenedens sp.]|nr:hypothetical protein [Candidatus Hydrogenedentota bacterium]NLF58974.1 hypothetical protein [Candidatus Hydrogenedens sp.]